MDKRETPLKGALFTKRFWHCTVSINANRCTNLSKARKEKRHRYLEMVRLPIGLYTSPGAFPSFTQTTGVPATTPMVAPTAAEVPTASSWRQFRAQRIDFPEFASIRNSGV